MKGSRQTSRHKRKLSIIHSTQEYLQVLEQYRQDSILHWQQVVCRKFIPLRLVDDSQPERIPASFEFRIFFWRNQAVGFGRYWWNEKPYQATQVEKSAALEVATEAAKRVNVPFLVVDAAQTVAGNWIVVECNDGQESGYAGVVPFTLWQNILDIERAQFA